MKQNLKNRIINRAIFEIAPFITRLSPKLNTILLYSHKFGKKPNLEEPKTLNEKILWLKFNTYWNNELIKQCADKYLVREYVKDKGLSNILTKLIAVYEKPQDIEWDNMPPQYAMKLNVGSGMNLIVSKNSEVPHKETMLLLDKWMNQKYWLRYSEMQYKDVKPYIIVEEYLGGEHGELPIDYKFYCMNGKVQLIMFCIDRDLNGKGAKYYYLDKNWKLVCGYGETETPFEKPSNLEEAIRYAEILSKDFPFVRVDFYLFKNKVIFGELTFTPAAGMDVDHLRFVKGTTKKLDDVYGELLNL